jgi:hypothetical protein
LAITAHLSATGHGGALTFHSERHGRFLLPLSPRDWGAGPWGSFHRLPYPSIVFPQEENPGRPVWRR